MELVTLWMCIGFLFAAYSVIANDSVQTLGTWIASNNEKVNENDILSKLIETSVSKDKPIVVVNDHNTDVGIITQSDLLKAVVEGNENE